MQTPRGTLNFTVAAVGLAFSAYGCAEPDEASPIWGGAPDSGTSVVQQPGVTGNPDGSTVGADSDSGFVPPAQGDSGAPPQGADSGLWCNARAVFKDACQSCHGSEVMGAPMSLVTHADTQGMSVLDSSKTILEAIEARIHDSARPMPPVSRPQLTSEQLAALDAWLLAGAPNGTCATPDETPTDEPEEFEWPQECEETYKIQAHQNGAPYNVPANYEGNVSITIPVPWANQGSGPVHALAVKPLTNNKRVVHHWILYAGTTEFITSWSPGKPAETFPADVGVYMPTSGTFRLNMHYYNVGNPNAEVDDSGLEICVTRNLRPKTATTKMFGPFLFSIPPNGMSTIEGTCTQNGNEPVHLITSSPHMHSYGVAAKFEIIRQNGAVELLHDTAFNWEDQSISKIDAVLNRGDKVKTTCVYNNTSGRTVRFGESSADEMCFNFSRYYPMGTLNCSGF